MCLQQVPKAAFTLRAVLRSKASSHQQRSCAVLRRNVMLTNANDRNVNNYNGGHDDIALALFGIYSKVVKQKDAAAERTY